MTTQQAFELWLFPYVSTAFMISVAAIIYLGNRVRQLSRGPIV